jgi:GNAT superfamily N-acetyltransferase
MIEQVTLRDGTDAFVVPLERTDRAQLAAEFETLSPESRRRRFLAPVRHLSDAMLEHLVDDVDGIDHVALVLCAETTPDVYDPVALARIVRYADVTDAADLAVTVKDEWQGRGVASALLDVLVRARPAGG